jgi:energy-coupling factor transporter ATP-binding protein EcfA2
VLTALENVELPLLLVTHERRRARKRAETALELVGPRRPLKHYPRQLSGGQEQRVAIARAHRQRSQVLLADEPTGDLDRKSAEEMLELLERLNREFKKTIVMVTHDPHAAERAHTPVPPRQGRAVQTEPGSRQELMLKLVLVNLFRNPLRTFLTMASVTVALFLFCALGGVLDTLAGVDQGGQRDRGSSTRNKISLVQWIPLRLPRRASRRCPA